MPANWGFRFVELDFLCKVNSISTMKTSETMYSSSYSALYALPNYFHYWPHPLPISMDYRQAISETHYHIINVILTATRLILLVSFSEFIHPGA